MSSASDRPFISAKSHAGSSPAAAGAADNTIAAIVNAAAHPAIAAAIAPSFPPRGIIIPAGADLLKVFPATTLGPQYFKDVLAPLPQVKLVPTGGVDLNTAGSFIKAGAAALCVGSAMTPKDAMAEGKWGVLTDIAARFVQAVKDARAA